MHVGWLGAFRRLKFAYDTHGLYEAIGSGWNHSGVIDATNRVFLYHTFLGNGCALLALLWLATEVGFHLSVRARAQQQAGDSVNIGLVHGAILGLLSLLLAFTYSFVAGRHDVRQALIVREANAIGTAFLRSGLLPETRAENCKPCSGNTWTRGYCLKRSQRRRAKSRRPYSAPSSCRPPCGLSSRDLAGRLPTVLDRLVFQAQNEVIDVHTERLAAAEYRLPRVILWLLCAIALMELALTGFGRGEKRKRGGGGGEGGGRGRRGKGGEGGEGKKERGRRESGFHGRRSMCGTGALAVLVMAVILNIIALDSPQQRFIRLTQTSLSRLRDRLQAETTTTVLPQPAPPLQRDTQ